MTDIASKYAYEENMLKTRYSSTQPKGQMSNKYLNLTKEEGEGLDKLTKRKDAVVFQTDKSGRFSVDTNESYVESTMPHVIGDAIVDEAMHQRAQKEINAHSTMWV